MPVWDIFNQDAFSLLTRSRLLSQQPPAPARIRSLGLFAPVPVRTPDVALESLDGTLGLVTSTPRGSRGETQTQPKGALRKITIPRFAREFSVKADEVDGVRVLGTDAQLATVQDVLAQKETTARRHVDTTEEFLMLGALRGEILDGDRSTVLYNLYDLYNLTPPAPIAFELDAANPDAGSLDAKVAQVLHAIEDAMDGLSYSGVHAFVGRAFFSALQRHPDYRDALANEGFEVRARVEAGTGRMISYKGITFEEYGRRIGGAPFVADDEAVFFPVGTTEAYELYIGPTDHPDGLNQPGLPRYTWTWSSPDGLVRHGHVQANILPICRKPLALRRGILGS
jgi:hypothetical protein